MSTLLVDRRTFCRQAAAVCAGGLGGLEVLSRATPADPPGATYWFVTGANPEGLRRALDEYLDVFEIHGVRLLRRVRSTGDPLRVCYVIQSPPDLEPRVYGAVTGAVWRRHVDLGHIHNSGYFSPTEQYGGCSYGSPVARDETFAWWTGAARRSRQAPLV